MTSKLSKTRLLRLDQILCQRGLCPDLAKARALIMAGDVVVADQRVEKPGALCKDDAPVRLKNRRSRVGRGGEKLAAALEHFALRSVIAQKTILDVGSSTGGFSEVCLSLDAKVIYAVDVGTNQMAFALRTHPQIKVFEKTDIRAFRPPEGVEFDLMVVDLSFISLRGIIASLAKLATAHTLLLLLVKPQFELPKSWIPKGGVVTDPYLHQWALAQVHAHLAENGLKAPLPPYPCSTKGRQGNQEYFILATKSEPANHALQEGRSLPPIPAKDCP